MPFLHRFSKGGLLADCRMWGALPLLAICCSCTRPSFSPDATPATPSALHDIAPAPDGQPMNHDGQPPLVFQDFILADVQFNNGSSAGHDTILETLGGGVAMLDYDHDGWLDLVFPGGGRYLPGTDGATAGEPAVLLRGGPDRHWDSVAHAAGLVAPATYTHGCSAADFDNDGFTDLVVTGYLGVQVFQNQGDGTFSESSSSCGISDSGWSTGAGWADLNGDGALDLYLVHYVEWTLAAHRDCESRRQEKSEICGPKHYRASDDRMFMSRGDGTFSDATAAVGLKPGGKGLGVVLGDIDLDGDVDVYVANDTTENFLYLNDGSGRLAEVGALQGVAFDENGLATGSMGVALADFDGDGLPDLWTTNFENETLALYRNLGQAQFRYVSRPAGVAAIGDAFVGWGTAFADFDRDGDLDVVVSNGHLPKYPPSGEIAQLSMFLINEGRGRFHPAPHAAGAYFSNPHRGRGLALGDLDRDGRLDLALSNMLEPGALAFNVTEDGGQALQVLLVGTLSNRDAIGARAVLETSAGSQLRQVLGGASYLSQSELMLHWGFPADTAATRLTISWPSGTIQTLDAPFDGTRLIIIEPRSEAAAVQTSQALPAAN
jgi:hypothetical protein